VRGIFVTGTDTDAGKTVISAGLVRALGPGAMGLKPVASGSRMVDGRLINEDAQSLLEVSSPLVYDEVNLCSLEPAIAPHLAARQAGKTLRACDLTAHVREVCGVHQRLAVVEGAGGWRVPLNDSEYFSDFALALGFPVLLVVRIKLGCINHALLSAEAITRDGLTLCGWVANGFLQESSLDAEVIESINDRLGICCAAKVPRMSNPSPAQVAYCFESNWLSGFMR
jgi:dethiobiotin synthetase